LLHAAAVKHEGHMAAQGEGRDLDKNLFQILMAQKVIKSLS